MRIVAATKDYDFRSQFNSPFFSSVLKKHLPFCHSMVIFVYFLKMHEIFLVNVKQKSTNPLKPWELRCVLVLDRTTNVRSFSEVLDTEINSHFAYPRYIDGDLYSRSFMHFLDTLNSSHEIS